MSMQASCNSDLYNDALSDDDTDHHRRRGDDTTPPVGLVISESQRQRTRASKVSKLLGEQVHMEGTTAVVDSEQARNAEKASSPSTKAKVNARTLWSLSSLYLQAFIGC